MTDESHKEEENLIEKTLEWINQGHSVAIATVRSWINIIIELSKLIDLQHPCCLITNLSTGVKSIIDHSLLKKS